jgi:hypothetical protein
MDTNELRRRAGKIVALKRFSALTSCQTAKSQGALIRDLTPEETATVAEIVLEMMSDDRPNSRTK